MTNRITKFSIAAIAAVALFVSAPAKADPIDVTLTGVSGGIQGDVYTSPYYGTVNGVANTLIVCDDFVHEVYPGESWTANVTNFSDLSGVRFQSPAAGVTLAYEQAGWLLGQLMSAPASQTGNISFAIWAIFEPTATEADSGWTTGANSAASWLAAAEDPTLDASFTTAEFSNISILTPTDSGPGSAQEYLTIVPTPEPRTFMLLAAGLLSLLLISGGKLRSKANQNALASDCGSAAAV